MKERLLKLLLTHAYQAREVVLASGQASHFYIDCKQVSFRGEGAFLIGRLFWEQMLLIEKERSIGFDACGGMALGAVPLVVALSTEAFRHQRDLPALAVRKEAKNHGTGAFVEGANGVPNGARVVLLEDVVTTGASTIKAAVHLREAGFITDTVLALVNREAGGEANLKKEGLTLTSLFNLNHFPKN